MEKEKQIEELAELIDELNRDVIIGYKPMKNGMIADIVKGRTAEEKAEALMEAGYGNVKEALKEFAERVKGIFSGNAEERQKGYAKEIGCSLTVGEFNEEIDELIKEVCGD